jgi:hypothetical protein
MNVKAYNSTLTWYETLFTAENVFNKKVKQIILAG